MPQLLYSPDLAPADFFLFSKLKAPMKGKHFAMIFFLNKNIGYLLITTRTHMHNWSLQPFSQD